MKYFYIKKKIIEIDTSKEHIREMFYKPETM